MLDTGCSIREPGKGRDKSEGKIAMLAVLFGQGEVFVIVIVTALVVFLILYRRRRKR